MKIIDKIKLTRILKGYSQTEFAERIGISQSHYSRIESGSLRPNIELVEKILDALELNIFTDER